MLTRPYRKKPYDSVIGFRGEALKTLLLALLLIIALGHTDLAQTKSQIPEIYRIRLAEAFRIKETFC